MIQRKMIALHGSALLLVALCGLVVAACGDQVSFNAANEAPGAGTSFIGIGYDYDTLGHIRSSVIDSVVVTVLPTLASYAGKTEVVPFQQKTDVHLTTNVATDTVYLHYEPNGDISLLTKTTSVFAPGISKYVTIPQTWLVNPFGAKINVAQVLRDTTYTYKDFSGKEIVGSIKATATQEFVGPYPVVSPQGVVNVVGVKSQRTLTVTDGAMRTQAVQNVFLYYSPKLKSIVQVDETDLTDLGNGQGLIERSHNGWQVAYFNLAN